jgi:hypothetical protein
MSGQRTILRDVLIATLLIALSFGLGWLAFGQQYAATRRVSFAIHWAPIELFEAFRLLRTPETAALSVGDRIDILVSRDGHVEPLLLDAIVYSQTTASFVILGPRGGRDMFAHANDQRLKVSFRTTVVVSNTKVSEAAIKKQAENEAVMKSPEMAKFFSDLERRRASAQHGP